MIRKKTLQLVQYRHIHSWINPNWHGFRSTPDPCKLSPSKRHHLTKISKLDHFMWRLKTFLDMLKYSILNKTNAKWWTISKEIPLRKILSTLHKVNSKCPLLIPAEWAVVESRRRKNQFTNFLHFCCLATLKVWSDDTSLGYNFTTQSWVVWT